MRRRPDNRAGKQNKLIKYDGWSCHNHPNVGLTIKLSAHGLTESPDDGPSRRTDSDNYEYERRLYSKNKTKTIWNG